MEFFRDELKKVRAFVFDVDGVLSSHMCALGNDGDMIRTSCAKDGYALMYSVRKGYVVAIISGGGTEGLQRRFEKLGIKEIHLKIADKVKVLEKFMGDYNLEPEEIVFMGDDIPDYEAMRRVGFPVAPLDACEEVKSIARYISDRKGGEGCVRDIVEQVLKARGDWMDTGCRVRSM